MMARMVPAAPPSSSQHEVWDEIGKKDRASWYLDPLVAEQKRRVHAALAREFSGHARLALKTDAFEEAYGDDSPLKDVLSLADRWLVIDYSSGIVKRAREAQSTAAADFVACDLRALPFADRQLDLVFSNSSLDHFDTREDFQKALKEIGRVMRPGGRLVITVDNPQNPGYWLLRWALKSRFAPFPLGYTPGPAALERSLNEAGFDVMKTGVLIHNPRGVSTLLFLSLRRVLGERADRPIRGLLAFFEWVGRWPTRRWTACYLTAQCSRR